MTRSQNTHVIIGAGAAGMAAASAIREQDRTARITVLSAESDRPYFRPMIPYLISGQKQPSEIAMEGRGPFLDAGADIRLSARAAAIERQHVAPERDLHRRKSPQLLQDDVGRCIPLQFDHDPHAVAVRFVLHMGDAFYLFLAHLLGAGRAVAQATARASTSTSSSSASG